MPLVWVSELLGCPLAERVTGVDLVPRLAELSVQKGYGIYLLGGKGDVAERAGKLLEAKFPGARIVGTYAPTEEQMEQLDHSEIVDRIQSAKPDILLVALGNPKQVWFCGGHAAAEPGWMPRWLNSLAMSVRRCS